jgi:hypothetical protein
VRYVRYRSRVEPVEVQREALPAWLLYDRSRRGRQANASRHLGPEAGAAYAETAGDDLLIRLAPGILRARDFADEFAGYH